MKRRGKSIRATDLGKEDNRQMERGIEGRTLIGYRISEDAAS